MNAHPGGGSAVPSAEPARRLASAPQVAPLRTGDGSVEAPAAAPSEAVPGGRPGVASRPSVETAAADQQLLDLLVAVQHALQLLRIRGGVATVDAVCPVVTNLTRRTCTVAHLAHLRAALSLCEQPEKHSLSMSWQRVPRRKGECPEEQLVISLPPVRPGEASHDAALRDALHARQTAAQAAGETIAPAIQPADVPLRPSLLATQAAIAAAAARAAAEETAERQEAQRILQADQAVRTAVAVEAAPAELRDMVSIGGVSMTALRAAAAAQVAAADVAAASEARTALRRVAALPRVLDALRSWLVGDDRRAAPLTQAVAALRAGVSAGSHVTGAVADDAEEVTAQVLALVRALPEWVLAEDGITPGMGTVLRFNPDCDLKPLRRRLVEDAKHAAEALREQPR